MATYEYFGRFTGAHTELILGRGGGLNHSYFPRGSIQITQHFLYALPMWGTIYKEGMCCHNSIVPNLT